MQIFSRSSLLGFSGIFFASVFLFGGISEAEAQTCSECVGGYVQAESVGFENSYGPVIDGQECYYLGNETYICTLVYPVYESVWSDCAGTVEVACTPPPPPPPDTCATNPALCPIVVETCDTNPALCPPPDTCATNPALCTCEDLGNCPVVEETCATNSALCTCEQLGNCPVDPCITNPSLCDGGGNSSQEPTCEPWGGTYSCVGLIVGATGGTFAASGCGSDTYTYDSSGCIYFTPENPTLTTSSRMVVPGTTVQFTATPNGHVNCRIMVGYADQSGVIASTSVIPLTVYAMTTYKVVCDAGESAPVTVEIVPKAFET